VESNLNAFRCLALAGVKNIVPDGVWPHERARRRDLRRGTAPGSARVVYRVALRIWQWLASYVVYGSGFTLELRAHIRVFAIASLACQLLPGSAVGAIDYVRGSKN